MRSVHGRLAAALSAVVAVAALAGCGSDTSPADAAPALGRQLDAVDAAVASHDYTAARTAIKALVDEAAKARADGKIDAAQADAIRSAASSVLAQLPQDRANPPQPAESPAQSHQPTPPPSVSTGDTGGDEEHADDDGEGNGDEGGHGHGHGHGDGGGRGHNSGNGPDDGHGN